MQNQLALFRLHSVWQSLVIPGFGRTDIVRSRGVCLPPNSGFPGMVRQSVRANCALDVFLYSVLL